MQEMLITVSVCLIGGLLMSRLAKKVGLPAVTAYLVMGLLLGPFFIGHLQIPYIGFHSLEDVEVYKIITQTALGFIAFTIGNEFRLEQLKSMGRQAIVVGIMEGVTTMIVVDIALITLHVIRPDFISLASAITLGAISSATAPAATLMVVKQYKADGPLTKLLLMVVALDDAVALICFAASYGVADALEQGSVNVVSVVVEPILEIVLSLVLGVLAGVVLNWIELFFHSRSKRMSISIAFVLLTVGVSMMEFNIGGVKISFSLLLVCMMTGTMFCNICSASEELMSRVDGWTSPLLILFFVLSGAELDLNVLGKPVALLIGVTYIIFRCTGKYTGAGIGSRITGCSSTIQKHLGITLFPQAGVALGMAVTAANLSDGAIVRNVVLFSVLVYELIGPALTKRSLMAAGEIHPEGRTVARKENEPRAGVSVK